MSDYSDSDKKADMQVLHSMGYAQELERRLSSFSNFAVSFSIICILSGGIMAIVAVLTKLPLPIVWGVGVSAVLTTSVSLVTGNSMNLRPLLPGFNESLPIDRQIFAACTFGALGTLLLSIGVGMWVNWPCVFLGVAGLWICIVMIDQAFKKYETEMRGATV